MSLRNVTLAILLVVVAVLLGYQGYTYAVPQIGPGSSSGIGSDSAPSAPGECNQCTVGLIDDPLVPAQEAGMLVDLNTPQLDAYGQPMLDVNGEPLYERIEEGMFVTIGQVLGHIDDRLSAAALTIAEQKVLVAEIEAEININGQYAAAAHAVALHQYDRVQQAEASSPGSISQFEIQRFWLEAERARLQVEQAGQEFKITEISVGVSKAELAQTQEMHDRRTITSPADGMVVEVFPDPGEWVEPGTPILQILRLDRLHVSGDFNIDDVLPMELDGKPATVTVQYPDQNPISLQGQVVFVDPRVDMRGTFSVRVEVENQRTAQGDWLLLPGMPFSKTCMTIHYQ